jgi:aryl-alcohol dehydrogenase-like predicted oxidoreductase
VTLSKSPLRTLGHSDLRVSSIGLGSAQFGKGASLFGKFWAVLEDDVIAGIIGASLEGGVNWIDTAEAYGSGESERSIATGLRTLGAERKDIIIASKWFPFFRTAKSIRSTISNRLEALGISQLDLYQIHNPWSFSSIRSQMEAMAKLVEEGHIRYTAVSNFSAKQLRTAHDELGKLGFPLLSNQVQYNLLDRRIEFNGVLDMARELGISILAYSPLAQGLLTGQFHDSPGLINTRPGFRKYTPAFRRKNIEKCRPIVETLEKIAAGHDATVAQVALSWTVNFHQEAIVAIVGATKVQQARENVQALSLQLSEAEMTELDLVSRDIT